jgi:hypothetical protein
VALANVGVLRCLGAGDELRVAQKSILHTHFHLGYICSSKNYVIQNYGGAALFGSRSLSCRNIGSPGAYLPIFWVVRSVFAAILGRPERVEALITNHIKGYRSPTTLGWVEVEGSGCSIPGARF